MPTCASLKLTPLLATLLLMACEPRTVSVEESSPAQNLSAAGATDQRPHHTIPSLPAEKAKKLIVDGRLDEPFWRDIPSLRLHPHSGEGGYVSTLKLAYTDDALIIGARFEDRHVWATMTERDDRLWREEVFEIFLAPYGAQAPYIEIQANPLATIFDARFEQELPRNRERREVAIETARVWDLDALEVATHVEGALNDPSIRDEFWSIEARIPFAPISTPPRQGDAWRANFYRIDRPRQGVTHVYSWSSHTGGNFHDLRGFGHLRFGAPLASAPGISELTSAEQERLRREIRLQIDSNFDPNFDPN